ncbi:MAG: cobyrinate a,c-diamide synthase [Desulfovibrio sp.]|jgi:cobyrinic acid a,c-diamide synthase|nr:cobyrinate a,c-diamide synthase [Desulfovibrio sp.]
MARTVPLLRLPRLVLAGTHSGAGKTSLAAALAAAFVRQGLSVFPYKIGPDYIDPAFHARIAGRPCRNLDSWLLPETTLRRIFCRSAAEDGLAVIEGVMGLFDGLESGHEGSTAQVARILDAPILLVLDAKGLSRSAAALVRGYDRFLPDVRLSGVLLNRVSGAKHYALLKAAVEDAAGVPCLGFLPAGTDFSLESRHLGLVPAQEVADLDSRITALAEAARQFLDLPALLRLARTAPPLRPPPETAPRGQCPSAAGRPLRIGLARDAAFSFYYQDNLDLLAELGAQIVPFSPLEDARLPENLHGLYLGGGFPEVFAPQLARNASLRSSLAAALEDGLPCYAECGGLVYLTQSITIPSPCRRGKAGTAGRDPAGPPETYPLAGFFPCRSVMTSRLQHFGYATLALLRDTLLGPAGTTFRVHEFHYSRLEGETEAAPEGADPGRPEAPAAPVVPGENPALPSLVYSARKPGGAVRTGGLARRNTLALYPHLHFHACPESALSFLQNCARIAGLSPEIPPRVRA